MRTDTDPVGRIELNRETYIRGLPSKIGSEASISLWRAYLSRVEAFAAGLIAICLFALQAVPNGAWLRWIGLLFALLTIPLTFVNFYYLRRYRRQAIRFCGVDPRVRGRIPHSSPAFERWRDSNQVATPR